MTHGGDREELTSARFLSSSRLSGSSRLIQLQLLLSSVWLHEQLSSHLWAVSLLMMCGPGWALVGLLLSPSNPALLSALDGSLSLAGWGWMLNCCSCSFDWLLHGWWRLRGSRQRKADY